MVPPGDNLEFQASGAFRDRVDQDPTILNDAKAALRNHPAIGSVIVGAIKRMDLKSAGLNLVVFFKRSRNVVGLLAIFEEHESALILAKENELRVRAAKGEFK